MKRCVHNYSQKALVDLSRLGLNTFLNIELVSHIFNKSALKRASTHSFKQMQQLNAILKSDTAGFQTSEGTLVIKTGYEMNFSAVNFFYP